MSDQVPLDGKFIYRHPRHHFAWVRYDASGLWTFVTIGWWTWQSTRTPKPIADRVLRTIDWVLSGKMTGKAA